MWGGGEKKKRWARVGSAQEKRKEKEKKIVGQLRIWPDRLRKLRNSFFKSFINFKPI
jgi:hypothetical protein